MNHSACSAHTVYSIIELALVTILVTSGGLATTAAGDENSTQRTPPYQPYNLTRLGYRVTNHQPTVSWVGGDPDPGDTVTYHLYLDQAATPTTEIWVGTATSTNQLGNLVDGQHYYWRLRPHDGSQWGNYSETVDFAMNDDPSIPTVVVPNTALNWQGGNNYQIDWSDSTNNDWPDPDDTITYQCYFSSNGGSSWSLFFTTTSQTYFNWGTPGINSSQCLIKVTASDGSEQSQDQSDVFFTIDSTNPSSSCTCGDFANDAPIAVGYTAADGFGTLDATQLWYRFDYGAWTLWPVTGAGASGTILFGPPLGEGLYEFFTIAFDLAGNEESAPPQPDADVLYDVTDPSSSASTSPYVNTVPLSIAYNAFDSLSGIDQVELWFRYESGSWTNSGLTATSSGGFFTFNPPFGDGGYDFYTRAVDFAGNEENSPGLPDTGTVLDRVAPTSAISPAPTAYTNDSEVMLHFVASDGSGSGIDVTTLWHKIGAAGTWGDSGLIPLSGTSGNHTYVFGSGEGSYFFASRTIDNAGNEEIEPTGSGDGQTIYDITIPNSTASVAAYSSEAPLLVNWTASDALSGPASTRLYYKFTQTGTWLQSGLDPQTGTSGVFEFTPSNEGRYYFGTRCVDQAGNEEPVPAGNGDTNCMYDATPPSSSASSPTYATVLPVMVDFTASDSASGIDQVTLWAKPAGGGWQSTGLSLSGTAGTFEYSPAGQGLFYLATVATDMAGNTEETPVGNGDDSTTVDTQAPVSQASSPPYQGSGSISVEWTASDVGSGIAQVSLWVKYQNSSWGISGLPIQTGSSGTFVYTISQGDGSYCFATVAVDQAGNQEAAPSGTGDTCTIFDTHSPSAEMLALPAIIYSNLYTMHYEFEDYSPGSGLAGVDVFYKKDAGTWQLYVTDAPVDGDFQFDFETTGGEGFYEFEVVAHDNAGNDEAFHGVAEAFTVKEPERLVDVIVTPAGGSLHPGAVVTVEIGLDTELATQLTYIDAYFFYDPEVFHVPGIQDLITLQDNDEPWLEDDVDVDWDDDGLDMDHVQFHKSGAYGITINGERSMYLLELVVRCDAPQTGPAACGAAEEYVQIMTDLGEDVTGAAHVASFTLTANQAPSDPVLSQSAGQWGGWLNVIPNLLVTCSDPNGDSFRPTYIVDSGFPVQGDWIASGATASYQPAGLTEGSHTWSAYAEDRCLMTDTIQANDGNPAFRLDVTDPGPVIGLQVSPAGWTAVDEFTLNWSNPADLSGIAAAYYKLDAAPTNDTDGTRVAGPDIGEISGVTVGVEGEHPCHVWIEDLAGNLDYLAAEEVMLRLDGSVPQVAFANINDGVYLNDLSYVITGTAEDGGSGVSQVEFSLENGVWLSVTGTETWEYHGGFPAEGDYQVQARAEDVASNSGVSPVLTVHMDLTAPVSMITSPPNGYITNDENIQVQGTAQDAGGVAQVLLSTDGGATYATATGTGSWTFAMTSPPSGSYQLVSKALDMAGNEEMPSTTTTIVVDRDAPLSSISYPTEGAVLTSPHVTITGTAWDDLAGVNSVEVTTDAGVHWDTAAGAGTWSYEWSVPADGEYQLASRAIDAAGNIQSVTQFLSVSIDTRAPAVLIGGYWSSKITASGGGDLVLLVYIADPDVASVEVMVGDTPTGLLLTDDGIGGDWNAGDQIYTLALPIPPGMAPGDYLIQVAAMDTAGNLAEWPHLHVAEGTYGMPPAPPDVEERFATAVQATLETRSAPPRQDMPLVYLGGYWETVITSQAGGELDLWAYAPDTDATGIASVELYFGAQPTGMYIPPAGGGLFRLTMELPAEIPAGDYLLELRAIDTTGRQSGLWPYLNIY
ncbi:hypothetical protein JW905_05720 [bacterium]|nr:hypothetical protein [candidate division CSSED10-310 bacterium]